MIEMQDDVTLRSQTLQINQGDDTKPRIGYNDEYIGEYEHPGLGIFTVFQDADATLRYEFGLLLSGELRNSSASDAFFMTLDPPLDYRMAYFDEDVQGYLAYFHRNISMGVDSISVPYLESMVPPTFIRMYN